MGTKRAVCVGLNYPGTRAKLSGCVNDAQEWAELLGRSGYSSVEVLLDAGGTKAAILAALRSMVSEMRRGDRLVFTYSGHGSWVPDRDGDEADARDEVLVPIDYAAGRVIKDDELNEVLCAHPRGSGVLVISDSCHSGTVSRFAGMTGAVGPGVPRFLSPAELVPGMSPERATMVEETTAARGLPRRTASLMSGCLDQEYSYDAWFNGRANGAFSRAALDSYHPGISLDAWHRAVRLGLPSREFPQTPALTAANAYRKYAKAL